jgi:hypothetical protein
MGEPPYFLEEPHYNNRRSTDDDVATIVPRHQWIVNTGAKGTIVIVDTTGLHKGGYCEAQERLLYTCMYVSPAWRRYD